MRRRAQHRAQHGEVAIRTIGVGLLAFAAFAAAGWFLKVGRSPNHQLPRSRGSVTELEQLYSAGL